MVNKIIIALDMVKINGFERGKKYECCVKEHPDLSELCDGTDSNCVNFEE